MVEWVRLTARDVKRWQSGEMALRGTATGMLEAEHRSRRTVGDRQSAALALAIEPELTSLPMTEEVATRISV